MKTFRQHLHEDKDYMKDVIHHRTMEDQHHNKMESLASKGDDGHPIAYHYHKKCAFHHKTVADALEKLHSVKRGNY